MDKERTTRHPRWLPQEAADPWHALRARVLGQASLLRPPLAGAGCCTVCRGPVRYGYSRCYQCVSQQTHACGMLADVVVPISYAICGTRYADDLWRYKAIRAGRDGAEVVEAVGDRVSTGKGSAGTAGAVRVRRPAGADRAVQIRLAALALVFLREHGRCLRRHADGQPITHLAVVPSGRGRTGQHPLRRMLTPYLSCPRVSLAVRAGTEPFARTVDVTRFVADQPVPGGHVLVVDDTWVSGASVQSAAAALKLSGARHVSVVVLGRHVNPDDPDAASLLAAMEAVPFDVATCAVQDPLPSSRGAA